MVYGLVNRFCFVVKGELVMDVPCGKCMHSNTCKYTENLNEFAKYIEIGMLAFVTVSLRCEFFLETMNLQREQKEPVYTSKGGGYTKRFVEPVGACPEPYFTGGRVVELDGFELTPSQVESLREGHTVVITSPE